MSPELEEHARAALEILKAARGVQGAVLLILTDEKTPFGYGVKVSSDLPPAVRTEVCQRVADSLRAASGGIILAH